MNIYHFEANFGERLVKEVYSRYLSECVRPSLEMESTHRYGIPMAPEISHPFAFFCVPHAHSAILASTGKVSPIVAVPRRFSGYPLLAFTTSRAQLVEGSKPGTVAHIPFDDRPLFQT